jgi:hypothetical protein
MEKHMDLPRGVVPHYIEGHQKNHILNHKKWDKLNQWD